MAVANTKSTEVTNADAAVQTLNNVGTSHARTYHKTATIAVAAADDDGSVFRFFRVHSSWRVLALWLYNDAITAGTVYDCGLYQIAANGGAVVDIDAYALAVDNSTARTTPIDIACEARDIIKIGQQVWQDAGLSADSNRWYDIALTGGTVGTAAGDITMRMEFSGNV